MLAIGGHPALLLRTAEPHEQHARARFLDRGDDPLVDRGRRLAVRRTVRERDREAGAARREALGERRHHGRGAAVEADRHAAPRGLLAHERHQRRAVHARGVARAERAQRPHERHAVGGDELGVVHERAERRVVPGLHHHVDVGDAGHAAARLGHREDRLGRLEVVGDVDAHAEQPPRAAPGRARSALGLAARAASGRAAACSVRIGAAAPALNSRATRRGKRRDALAFARFPALQPRAGRPMRSGVGRRSTNRGARARALDRAAAPLAGCGRAPRRAELPGAWWAGRDRRGARAFSRRSQQLEGTPLARRARELAAALPECECGRRPRTRWRRSPSSREGARCLAEGDPLERIRRASGSDLVFALAESRRPSDGIAARRAAIRGRRARARSALARSARRRRAPPARARRRAGRPRSARERGATRLAARAPARGTRPRRARARRQPGRSAVPAQERALRERGARRHLGGGGLSARARRRDARDRRSRSASRCAAPRWPRSSASIADLQQTWPVHRSELRGPAGDGACLPDLNVLPELAPCYVATADALVVGWNADEPRSARSRARAARRARRRTPTPPRGSTSTSR